MEILSRDDRHSRGRALRIKRPRLRAPGDFLELPDGISHFTGSEENKTISSWQRCAR